MPTCWAWTSLIDGELFTEDDGFVRNFGYKDVREDIGDVVYAVSHNDPGRRLVLCIAPPAALSDLVKRRRADEHMRELLRQNSRHGSSVHGLSAFGAKFAVYSYDPGKDSESIRPDERDFAAAMTSEEPASWWGIDATDKPVGPTTLAQFTKELKRIHAIRHRIVPTDIILQLLAFLCLYFILHRYCSLE
ncbi:hypothetical protein OH76DRAFT_707754 [Lentinus brumalis]|uniref:Uncharacterized protein n=1 Tax=Lentinus brumalis TaxID=2498619 RepID=A0A371D5V9_9APHY|nr:hypothetical protein OH76DRAFT_707754 [Polyporus brumalis]